jgi:hypothetical protein
MKVQLIDGRVINPETISGVSNSDMEAEVKEFISSNTNFKYSDGVIIIPSKYGIDYDVLYNREKVSLGASGGLLRMLLI